jgi:hypothetical protein
MSVYVYVWRPLYRFTTEEDRTAITYIYIYIYMRVWVGARGSVVVKALCYKPEGRGFDSR